MSVGKIIHYHISKTILFTVAVFMHVTEVNNSRPSLLPVIMDNPKTVTHKEGEIAILFCSVLNLEEHTVTWRKLPGFSPLTIGTKSWTRDSRVHAEHVPNSSQWNLVIEKVDISDAGDYECQVSKRKSHLRHKVTLVVKAKPIALLPRIEISGENILKVGSLLQLTCNATLADVAVETIAWIKDGEPLLQGKDNRYSVHTSLTLNDQSSGIISSKLEVRDVRIDDSGVYLCRSTERIQMAGVKVEIQGTHNYKRADMKKVDHSDEHFQPPHSGTDRTTLFFNSKHSENIHLISILFTICTLFCAS